MMGNSNEHDADEACRCTRTPITDLSKLNRETTGEVEPFIINEEEFPYISTYRRLRKEPQEIRLLSRKPSHSEGDISLSIETYDLKTCPQYIALSYTWGSKKDMRTLTLDGQPVQIRKTLFEFLQSLPEEATKVPFWLDVLCINQRDVEERNNQVAVMSTIYRQAIAVYSWLGPSTSNIASAHELLNRCQIEDTADRPKYGTVDHRSNVQQRIEEKIMDWHIGSEDWCEGLKELFIREYWSRVWILQETIVAKRLWILAGQCSFSFEDIRTAQRAIRDSSQSQYHRPVAQPKQAILSIHLGRQKFASAQCLQKDDFFMFIRRDGCRDPRDIVFALHGVLPNLVALKPDYNKTTIEVWWQTCAQLFAENFFDSIRLWEAMRPTATLATVDIAAAFPGEMLLNVYPWHYFHKTSGSLLGTAALPFLQSFRTDCPQHFAYVARLGDGQKIHSNMALQYFENFVPESSDVLLMCQRPGSDLWCSILRPHQAETADFVGVGVEQFSYVNYRHVFGEIQIQLDAKLVAASKIALYLKDDWKAPDGPGQEVTPGTLQLNGAAAILLHQIKALFN